MLQLILGGARSGKSRLAEQTAKETGLSVIYIATAQALDTEMQQRIAHHKQQRPAHWQVFEEPTYLADRLLQCDQANQLILVDCLTLWLTNVLFAGDAARQAEAGEVVNCPRFSGEIQALIDILPTLPGRIIMVSNEVGWGLVPMAAVSRLFADEQGRLNQRVAAVCEQVTLVAAGLPLKLK